MSELILRHFTSEKKWDMIQKSKYLLPKSIILDKYEAEKFSLQWEPRTGIVCIPTYAIDAWDEYGLMGYVNLYTSGKIALDFPSPESENVFVRDHSINSPKYYLDNYGFDLFGESFFPLLDSFFSREENEIINEQVKQYFKSTIRLDKYRNNYAVPEMWVTSKIHISKIEMAKWP